MTSEKQQTVIILGSTGSIGINAINVAKALPDRFKIVGLTAGNNAGILTDQIKDLRPEYVAVANEGKGRAMKEIGYKFDTTLFLGDNGILELIEAAGADIVVGAITGWAGFLPCIKALETGCRLALANKETLVVGGQLVKTIAEENNSEILPIDSEESAIFQALQAGKKEELKKIYLTASGGPFHDWAKTELQSVTVEQALCHPNWDMGRKITIDSATLMNKALEIVETSRLFDVGPEKIQVLLHPQSIIHSMVEFVDASIIAQVGAPDMKVPIQYAMTYPERIVGAGESLDLSEMQKLEIRAVAPHEYPALELGFQVAEKGGTSGAVLNGANEIAVDAFLNEQIRFNEIVEIVSKTLTKHNITTGSSYEELLAADQWARTEAIKCLEQL